MSVDNGFTDISVLLCSGDQFAGRDQAGAGRVPVLCGMPAATRQGGHRPAAYLPAR